MHGFFQAKYPSPVYTIEAYITPIIEVCLDGNVIRLKNYILLESHPAQMLVGMLITEMQWQKGEFTITKQYFVSSEEQGA
jgi:hypothetical protein